MSAPRITWDRREWSITELARAHGLLPQTVAYRIKVKGMRPPEALAPTPRMRRARRK